MVKQSTLTFSEIPISCSIQKRYHVIAPILANQVKSSEQAQILDFTHSTIMRWLKNFREKGMLGLVDGRVSKRPNTSEKTIAMLFYLKCCAPMASDHELARVITTITEKTVRNETVRSILSKYTLCQYTDLNEFIHYPIPINLEAKRQEITKLDAQGWSQKTIAHLLKCSHNTVSNILNK